MIWLYSNSWKTFYVPEIDMNVRIEKRPFRDAIIFFSKTTEFGDDYIQYHWYPDGPGIDIYYIKPNIFYVINSGDILRIKTSDFHICEMKENSNNENNMYTDVAVDSTNWWVKPYLRTMKDSAFIQKTQYVISVWGTQWFEVFNKDGDIVFKR